MRLTTKQLVYHSKSLKMEIKISNVLGYIKCTEGHAWGFLPFFFHHVARETVFVERHGERKVLNKWVVTKPHWEMEHAFLLQCCTSMWGTNQPSRQES